MHAPATKSQPEKSEKVFEIRDLNGKVHDTRPTYWLALMVGYMTLRCGNFVVEERK